MVGGVASEEQGSAFFCGLAPPTVHTHACVVNAVSGPDTDTAERVGIPTDDQIITILTDPQRQHTTDHPCHVTVCSICAASVQHLYS